MISVFWAAKYLCKLCKIKKKRDEWIILLSSANTEHPLQLSLVCSDGTLHANMIMLLIFVNLQGVLSYMNMKKPDSSPVWYIRMIANCLIVSFEVRE